MAVSHIKSNTIGDFTGTFTGFNSQGSTATIAATDLVRPSDWNSVHNQYFTLHGNTNNASTASGTNVILSGGSNVTLIGNGASIGFSAAGHVTNDKQWQWPPGNLSVVAAMGNGSFSINRMQIDGDLSATRVDVPFLVSLASSAAANTWGIAVTCIAGIYTRNSDTLSSVSSGSVSFSLSLASNTAGSTQVIPHAVRGMSVPMNVVMSGGEYYVGFGISTQTSSLGTATTALGNTWSVMGGPVYSSAVPHVPHFTNTTNTSTGLFGGQGVYSAAISTVPPTVSISAINQTGSYYARGNMGIIFRNSA
jgi:hypothetical protein